MSAELVGADWDRLRAMRAGFLSAERGGLTADYWLSRRDLELYDATFAQRIGWKWDAVLHELALRRASPRAATLVDFGCGTGIAARKFVAVTAGVERVFLVDRSKQARSFARDALKLEFPQLDVLLHGPSEEVQIDVLLVSHVLGELTEDELEPLLALVRRARSVLWLEPGSRLTARRLSATRDALLEEFDVVAPCTHRALCGALADERNWCHFFAKAPTEAFTSAFWSRFADELGIDLRALAYSFVALQRRGQPVPDFAGAARILGRPRMLKGRALLDACTADGVAELTLLARTDKALFKRLDRCAGQTLVFDLELDGARIRTASSRLDAP